MTEELVQWLKRSPEASGWERILSLYELHPDRFYWLASHDCTDDSPEVRDAVALAHFVRFAVRATYEICSHPEGIVIRTESGAARTVPSALAERVADFLRRVDGKSASAEPGKDFVGRTVTEDEMIFKLGDRGGWNSADVALEQRRTQKPMRFFIDRDDLEHLRTQPAYVAHQLKRCAESVILAPTTVFHDLKRGASSPTALSKGWAFCGKPRHAFQNDGTTIPAPDGMVFVAYATEDGRVFDWDWVREDTQRGCPIDSDIRFENPFNPPPEAYLEIPAQMPEGAFDARKPCYSQAGDCIFCYICDDLAFAERINPDLTVFRSVATKEFTGLKIKNVLRILEQDRSIVIDSDPEIRVSVTSALLATLKFNPDSESRIYQVLIEALIKGGNSPSVKLPAAAAHTSLARTPQTASI